MLAKVAARVGASKLVTANAGFANKLCQKKQAGQTCFYNRNLGATVAPATSYLFSLDPFEEVLITAQPKNEEDMGGVLKKAALQSLKRGVDVFVAVAHYLPLALDSIYRGIQESHRVAPQTSKNQIDETMLLWRS